MTATNFAQGRGHDRWANKDVKEFLSQNLLRDQGKEQRPKSSGIRKHSNQQRRAQPDEIIKIGELNQESASTINPVKEVPDQEINSISRNYQNFHSSKTRGKGLESKTIDTMSTQPEKPNGQLSMTITNRGVPVGKISRGKAAFKTPLSGDITTSSRLHTRHTSQRDSILNNQQTQNMIIANQSKKVS